MANSSIHVYKYVTVIAEQKADVALNNGDNHTRLPNTNVAVRSYHGLFTTQSWHFSLSIKFQKSKITILWHSYAVKYVMLGEDVLFTLSEDWHCLKIIINLSKYFARILQTIKILNTPKHLNFIILFCVLFLKNEFLTSLGQPNFTSFRYFGLMVHFHLNLK